MYLLLGLPYISVYRSTIALVSVSAGGRGMMGWRIICVGVGGFSGCDPEIRGCEVGERLGHFEVKLLPEEF